MIHGSSSDPVLIKKIAMRIWTLRAEVESIVEERILEKGGKDIRPIDISDLVKEYSGEILAADQASKTEEAAILEIAPSDDATSDVDNSEDLMAKAIAGEDVEIPETTAAKVPSDAESAEVVSVEKNLEESEYLIQRRPNLPPQDIAIGKTILSEFYMDKMYFFCGRHFLAGESIVIEFLVPKAFIVNAHVLFSTEYNMKSRIISENKLPYRTGVKFSFLRPGERTLLRHFLTSIGPTVTKKGDDGAAKKGSDSDPDLEG